MIAAPAFRPFEMAENVAAMVVEAVDQKTAKGFVGPPAGVSCDVERYDPIGGANADIHRAGPVGAEARRVGAIEIDDLVAQFLNIPLRRAPSIAPRCREHGGDGQLREMLHPRELPRKLDVGAGWKSDALFVEAVLGAPAVAGAKIEVPINGPVIGPRDQAPGLRSPFLIGAIDDPRQPAASRIRSDARPGWIFVLLEAWTVRAISHFNPSRTQQIELMGEIALGNARQRGCEVVRNAVGGHRDAARNRTTFIDVTVGGGVSFARRRDPLPHKLRSETRRLLRRLVRRQSQGSLQIIFQEGIQRARASEGAAGHSDAVGRRERCGKPSGTIRPRGDRPRGLSRLAVVLGCSRGGARRICIDPSDGVSLKAWSDAHDTAWLTRRVLLASKATAGEVNHHAADCQNSLGRARSHLRANERTF